MFSGYIRLLCVEHLCLHNAPVFSNNSFGGLGLALIAPFWNSAKIKMLCAGRGSFKPQTIKYLKNKGSLYHKRFL